MFGPEESGRTWEDIDNIYVYKLSKAERKYYNAWTRYKSMKLRPWQYFNTRGKIYRDHILMIEQFQMQFNERKKKKEQMDELRAQQNQVAQAFMPNNSSQRRSRVQSVL